jgi:hypothetical protein
VRFTHQKIFDFANQGFYHSCIRMIRMPVMVHEMHPTWILGSPLKFWQGFELNISSDFTLT